MPQTRFVTRKALALGLKPIVVVNKVDRESARPDWVVNQTFDLMDKLGANDDQLDFPVVYASALNGWASLDSTKVGEDMRPLFDSILKYVPEPSADHDGSLQLQISAVDYTSFLGRIAVGRIRRGTLRKAQEVMILSGNAAPRRARIGLVRAFQGLEKVEMDEAAAGEIVSVTGIEDFTIGDTFASTENPEALPFSGVDEPTLTMNFQVNTSPFAGQEGKYVTSRQIRDRLTKELMSNVALRVEDTDDADIFRVSGRGELHLTILIENMRREGYEVAVGKPRVVVKDVDGERHEPWEILTVDVEQDHQGRVMEELGRRGGELQDMVPDGKGRVRLDYKMPSRGLIGFHMEFMTLTRGTGIKSHVFDEYAPGEGRAAVAPQRRPDFLRAGGGGRLRAVEPRGARPHVRLPRRARVRGDDHRHPQPRQRPHREPRQGQEAHQRARGRQGRERAPHAAHPAHARGRRRVHRRRRAGGSHAQEHPPAQAPPARARQEARHARGTGGLTGKPWTRQSSSWPR